MAARGLLLLLASAGAARTRLHHRASLVGSSVTRPLRFAERFCMAKDLKMACEENSEMTVYSAFYNRRFDRNCPPIHAGGAESCLANFTERLLHCNGQRECVMPASEHSYCSEKPYQGIRAVWSCSPSRKKAVEEELDEEEELEVVTTGGNYDDYLEALEVIDEVDENDFSLDLGVPEPEEAGPDSIPAVDEDQDIRYAKKFCTGQELVLACEDSWRVEPYSAFYNSRKAEGCESASKPDCGAHECSCAPNATELLLSHCPPGSQRCALPPAVHRFCDKRPFNFMRVVWDCVKDGASSRSVTKHQVA